MSTREDEIKERLAEFDALPLRAKLARDFAVAAEDIRVLLAEITTLRARVAELEEGLRPFVKMADRYSRFSSEKDVPDSFWVYVELGDCRRARALLTKPDGGCDGG